MTNLTIFLLAFLITPFFSFHTIFMLYDIKKIGMKNLSKKQHNFFIGICSSSIICYVMIVIVEKGMNSIPLLPIMLICIMSVIFHLFLFLIIKDSPFLNSIFRKVITFIFIIILSGICLIYCRKFFLEVDKISSTNIDIQDKVEAFASENELFAFESDDLTLAKVDESSNLYFSNDDSYYFCIHTTKNEKEILVVDKNSNDNFELTLPNFDVYSNDICKEFDIHSLYNGFNVYDMYYLIGKDSAYKISKVIDKDSDTDEFYVTKVILLDLKTGKMCDF